MFIFLFKKIEVVVNRLSSVALLSAGHCLIDPVLFCFLKILFISDRAERREKERERNINLWLLLALPLLGTWPTTQAPALTGNPASPLSHTGQGDRSCF